MNPQGVEIGYRRRNRKIPLFGGLLFAGLLALSLVSCLDLIWERPTFILRDITLSPRGFLEMNILVGFDVENPNHFDLTLKSFEYTVSLNDVNIGSGHLEHEIVIPASSKTPITAPITAKFENLGKTVKVLLAGGELRYKIAGQAEIQAFFGSKTLPFAAEGRLDTKQHGTESK